MEPVQALIFDVYGTLFDINGLVQSCEELAPGQGAQLCQLWRSRQLEYTWQLSLMGRYENLWQVSERALIYACRALDIPADAEQQAALMRSYLHLPLYPDVLPLLNSLAGRTLALLSNGAPAMLDAMVRYAGLDHAFEMVLSVDELRVYKPDPRVYAFATRRIGLPPAQIGFVSSNSWDVAGANSFGLRTIWVNRTNEPPDQLPFGPETVIHSLDELRSLVM